MVILDTNIIIDHLRLAKTKESQLVKIAKQKLKEKLALCMISIQELYEGQSTRKEQMEQFLLSTIAPLKILPYTYETANLAGQIARDLKQPIEIADSAIAATTILNAAKLFTLNPKDFKKIKDLSLYFLPDS